jgi:hypothetical protein
MKKTHKKQPALMKAVKRPASLKTKDTRKTTKTTKYTSEEDKSFKEDANDEYVDDADEDADVDDEEEDDGDENDPDDGEDEEDEEGYNTDEEASEVDNEEYETIPWGKGGELIFVRNVARIIAIADTHYPGFVHNIKQINDALQLTTHLTRTAKNTYKDIEDRNYMERISQTEVEKEAEEERAETSLLGTQVDNSLGMNQERSQHRVVDNEQNHKLPGSPQGSSGHGDAGTQ